MESMADRVRARRKQLNMSQAKLAKEARVSQSTIAHIEAGRNETKNLLQIADALKVDPRWLKDGTNGVLVVGNGIPAPPTTTDDRFSADVVRRSVLFLEDLLEGANGEMSAEDKATAVVKICSHLAANPDASQKEVFVKLLKLVA
ncbi:MULTISPECIES: helix-turn-helix transcriptional regulator [Ralstonia]|jgi:transcriptional regulator with XRE-family HTH domain|nr:MULTISPECIES: helix-turn-helix transcriptional regulator [Ralstonia]MBL4778426.1 helix-turn-helix transcriptional regulator [Ralstonia sp.]MCM3582131.1 helix-turn-helix transcriptional regulator [Ralstonia pickettii]